MPYEITTNFTYLSSFVQFSSHLHHRFRELAIQRDIPPSSLYSSPQQRTNLSTDRLTIAILSSTTYLYYLYQFVKERQ